MRTEDREREGGIEMMGEEERERERAILKPWER